MTPVALDPPLIGVTLPKEAKAFRRDVRRLAAAFISQKLSHAEFMAAVRRSAAAAAFIETRRISRDERTMNALAWGKGTIAPGGLPAALEPLFDKLAAGAITPEAFALDVRRLLDQVKDPD